MIIGNYGTVLKFCYAERVLKSGYKFMIIG